MNGKRIPEGTISRLFIYLREVAELARNNIRTVSSAELGERANLSDAQVRKDLGYFGQFGVSGSGYDTVELQKALQKILGKDRTWNVAVIGAGQLGAALVQYTGFAEHGLEVVALFDSDPGKIGRQIGGIKVQSVEELNRSTGSKRLAIGIIAVPAEAAQEVAGRMVQAGIGCILNFAPVGLNVPETVKVKNVDLSHELETLSYFLVNQGKK